MKNIFGYSRAEDGATAVEFALIAIPFLVFIVGIYAAGIYLLTWNRMQYGTEVAARYASVHDDAVAADLEEIVIDSMSILSIDPDALTVGVEYTSLNGIDFAEVTSSYQFSLNLPLLPAEVSDMSLQTIARIPVN